MGRFEGFYTGEEANVNDGGFANSEVFAQRRKKKEREEAKIKQREQWKVEYQQCSTRKALKQYIDKYQYVTENPYVGDAREKLDEIDFKSWKDNEHDLKLYLVTHPKGKYVDEAKKLISQMRNDAWNRNVIKADRKEKLEIIFGLLAVVAAVTVFCLDFFGTEANFMEAGGAALGAGAPIAGIYYFFVRPFFE